MWNAGLDESQAGIKIAGRNITNLRYADDTALMAESEEELKSLLMKEEREKIGLKLNVQKTKFMASGPITSWQIDRETMETVTDLIFLSSKITADDDCSHETQRCLLLGRKAMTNIDSIFKSRDVTLPTKVHLVSSVQLLSRVQLFVTLWTAARQASLSITNSRSLPKLTSMESVMPSNHLILCRSLLLPPSIFPSIRGNIRDSFQMSQFFTSDGQSIGASASFIFQWICRTDFF